MIEGTVLINNMKIFYWMMIKVEYFLLGCCVERDDTTVPCWW